MKKLFKLLSLLRLLRELRYTMRGHKGHAGHRGHAYHGDHWRPRSRSYRPLYRRSRSPKLAHLLRDLLSQRRY